MTIYDGYYAASIATPPESAGRDQKVCGSAKKTVLSPAARIFCAIALAAAGLTALGVLGDVPAHIAHATPAIADLENWLVWGDLQRF